MGFESIAVKLLLVGGFIMGLILIIPTKRERTYLFRGEVQTLKQIVERICFDGVIVSETADQIEVDYDHNPDAIPEVMGLLREAELPARVRFRHPTNIVIAPPSN